MWREQVVILLLVLVTGAVYWQVGDHAFIEFDDDRYVFQNPKVQAGLTWDGLVWAFTTTTASNWHPITWLSHMLDGQLYGLDPKGHHLTNLLFHVANSVILFLLFRRMTGALWRSAFVAALFALHPFHVESVAWVSERKDLLSTFFWWLVIWLYLGYLRSPDIRRYLAMLAAFALGLMAKSMLVTLPFTLLLLDYWPLRRLDLELRSVWDRVREKIPLFVLTLVASVVAVATQRGGRALIDTGTFPIDVRIANALVSYATYLFKTVWPNPLAAYYPHPLAVEPWLTMGAAALLILMSLGAIRLARRHRYILMGWCWYLGTLVPVIGLVQVGTQAMADRYTYVPLVGLFIVLAWGTPELIQRGLRRQPPAVLLSALAGTTLMILAVCTTVQAARWKDTVTLFRHTLDVTTRNPMAHGILATALSRSGEIDESMHHFEEGLRLKPDMPHMHNNLGILLFRKGRMDEAIAHYRAALRAAPDHHSAHNNLGTALYKQGRFAEATVHLSKAVRLRPDSAQSHNNLASVLDAQGQTDQAIRHYREALRLRPNDASAHNNLGGTLYSRGEYEEAVQHLRNAIRLRPDFAKAHRNLALALRRLGRNDEAAKEFEAALEITPDDEDLRLLLQHIRETSQPARSSP